MKQCTLADLGLIITGKTPSTQKHEYWGGDIPFVTPKDIQASKHIFSTERYLTKDGAGVIKGCILPENAICVSCIGNIGYASMTTCTSVTNQQINSIIVNKDNDADFVYYLIKYLWPCFKNYEGQSTALSILNKTQFAKISVSVPDDKQTQIKIAVLLSALDTKIEQNTAINNNLEQQAQALFKSWFVDFEPFGGTMPADWTSAPLSKFVGLTQGKYIKDVLPTKTDTHKYLVYGGGGVRGYTTECTHKLPAVIVGCRGTCGIVSRTFQPASITNSVISFDIEKYFGINFLYFYLKNRGLEEFISGSAVPQITKTALNNVSLLVPDEVILNRFENVASAFYDFITKNIIENEQLATIRDALLPRLISGEIDVSKVDISNLGCLDKSLFNKETE